MSKRTREQDAQAAQEAQEALKKRRQVSPPPGGYDQVADQGNTFPVGWANNVYSGVNYGTVNQFTTAKYPARPDILTLLNPMFDASHTRNMRVSPPSSRCLPGTRQRVIGIILSWAYSALSPQAGVPHILWIYGYAGCGKSAISQAVAERLAQEGRLAASFFFFRGAGDRSRVTRFANTIAHQLATAFPATATIIEDAVRANTGLLSASASSLGAQFEYLVLRPIAAVADSLQYGPLIIVLDGVDECEDKDEVAEFMDGAINFFLKNPRIPVRFIIASRVENHIHRELHSSSQVQLLNLVDQTSDDDIEAAVDASIAKEQKGRLLACDDSWPSWYDKKRLITHIGKSFIFMTTILKALFDPGIEDELTPMDRLPILLGRGPDFDNLYVSLLEPLQRLPHFLDIISSIALARQAISIAQIAELLEIRAANVINVLIRLHAIMQVPGDDRSPVTLWHTSLRNFLCSENRAGPFFASPVRHQRLAYGAIRIAASRGISEASEYARKYAMDHLLEFLETVGDDIVGYDTLLADIMPDLVEATFEDGATALEVACGTCRWKLVHALVNGNADVNVRFRGIPQLAHALANANADVDVRFQRSRSASRTALHAAFEFKQKDIIYLLLDKGADPNIIASHASWSWVAQLDQRQDSIFRLPNLINLGEYGYPLLWAVCEGDVNVVDRLLACGANPSPKLKRPLVKSAGPPTVQSLHVCAYEGTPEIARALLRFGVDPNIKGRRGMTPLHYACLRGHTKIVACLLEFGADLNIQDDCGDTPLHLPCYQGTVEVAELLLSRHADTSIENMWGKTALQCAQESRRPEVSSIVEMFLRWGADSRKSQSEADKGSGGQEES